MSVLERELKLRVAHDFNLVRLEAELERFTVSPVKLLRIHTVYYDTEDYRLARWGCSLRFRHGEGWTLKLPVPSEVRGLARKEYAFAGDETQVPTEAQKLATAYLRGERLVRVAELRTLRTSRQVSDGRSDIANLAEDDVRVLDCNHIRKRFRQLEIELTDQAPDSLLEDLEAALRRRGAGKPDPLAKNVRAIGRRVCHPEIGPAKVRPAASVDDLLRATLSSAVVDIVRYDAPLRSDPKPEIVHHARVAVRRLRSHLRAFLRLLDAQTACALRDRLAWLQDVLSKARDADVFLDTLTSLAEELPLKDREAVTAVRGPYEAERQAAYGLLSVALGDERYIALLDDIIDVAKRPPLARGTKRPARRFLSKTMADNWSTLRRRVRQQRDDPHSDRNLHRIRIAAKRLRYLAEATSPIIGRRARKLAHAAERLQSMLGDQHDNVTARERLRNGSPDAGRAFLMGELAAVANAGALRGCNTWRPYWRSAKRRYRAIVS